MSGEKMKVIIVEDEFLAQQELSWLMRRAINALYLVR